ncbi:MAG: thioredoxin-disulfide reductase [Cyanobacteria bacterium P01_G01_bin.4]
MLSSQEVYIGILRERPEVFERRSVVIIGSGPGGLTAAIYLARANLSPLIIQGGEPGGQLLGTSQVENYPGFADGILGPELMQNFEAQAVRFGAELRYGTVTSIDFSSHPFRLTINGQSLLFADAVIIATGASAQYLGLASEFRLRGYGVSVCATCDGSFFQGQEIAVVGGGNTAIEEALFLTRFASRVSVIHRREKLRAEPVLQNRALANEKLVFHWNSTVKDILGATEVEGIAIEDSFTGQKAILPVKGVFIAIGHSPNTSLFKGWVQMDERGYIVTHCHSTRTSVPGVFACGDVQDPVYRQAITAAGSGCMAAIDALSWLTELTHSEHLKH